MACYEHVNHIISKIYLIELYVRIYTFWLYNMVQKFTSVGKLKKKSQFSGD